MLPLDPPLRRTNRIGGAPDPTAWRLFEDTTPPADQDQADHARDILDFQPENLLAMAMLAHDARSVFEHMAIVREAVRIGQRLWAPQLSGLVAAPDWGESRDAMPFLTCVLTYSKNLVQEGNRDEAIQCLRFLLKLDPSDRLGAVDKLAEEGLVLAAETGLRMS